MQSCVCLPSCLVRMHVFAQFKNKWFEQFYCFRKADLSPEDTYLSFAVFSKSVIKSSYCKKLKKVGNLALWLD